VQNLINITIGFDLVNREVYMRDYTHGSIPRVPKNFFPKSWSFPTRQKVLEGINNTIFNILK
jgi:hypothetical protein